MSKQDWQKTIKRLLREAWITQNNLPRSGTRPAGYGSTMPDYIRDVSESYGYDAATIGRITPTAAQIDRLDMVLRAVASQNLEPIARTLVWARAANIPWKKIKPKHTMARSGLARVYDHALAEIALRLVADERRAA